jgi:hypothetical protein
MTGEVVLQTEEIPKEQYRLGGDSICDKSFLYRNRSKFCTCRGLPTSMTGPESALIQASTTIQKAS